MGGLDPETTRFQLLSELHGALRDDLRRYRTVLLTVLLSGLAFPLSILGTESTEALRKPFLPQIGMTAGGFVLTLWSLGIFCIFIGLYKVLPRPTSGREYGVYYQLKLTIAQLKSTNPEEAIEDFEEALEAQYEALADLSQVNPLLIAAFVLFVLSSFTSLSVRLVWP
jgi:hypothetical protein